MTTSATSLVSWARAVLLADASTPQAPDMSNRRLMFTSTPLPDIQTGCSKWIPYADTSHATRLFSPTAVADVNEAPRTSKVHRRATRRQVDTDARHLRMK